VVIYGDSHTRGLSARLSTKLSNSFEVIGYTKPNCDLRMLFSNRNHDIAHLTKKNVLVLIMGVKDVTSDNFLKELRYLLQFVNQNTQTNIILLTVPLRYDQASNVY
jgi:hypothetical protein